MKSRFAKFVDNTLGAALIFLAAVAVLVYFYPADIAIFSALSVTATAYIILRFRTARAENKLRVSKATEDMFFDFMFESERLPARLLAKGLTARGANAAVHGNGVYCGQCAAFFMQGAPGGAEIARAIARAKKFGAKKIIIICKAPVCVPELNDFSVKCVCGDDAYRLFASLDALPEHKYPIKTKKRFAALGGALGKDKAARYAALSAAMFAIFFMLGANYVILACAVISAALFFASIIYNLAKKPRQDCSAGADNNNK